MFTRMLILTLMFTLALPVATLTRPAQTSPSPWGEIAVAAKGKHHKKKGKKQKTTTVTRTVRGPITQTFTSSEPITIPNGAPGTTIGPASPYPAAITVSGLPNGVITDVDLLVLDVTHKVPTDVDILLSAPLPQNGLDSGVFRPTDIPSGAPDTYAAPAPAPDGSVALNVFDGANPNGTWQLWVMDDSSGDIGDLGGWALRITAEVDLATVDEPVPAGKDAKKHKRKRRR